MSKLSLPVVQPQPATAEYSVHSLDLFQLYMDRPSYEAAFGAQAPAFIAARALKQWKDDSKALLDPATVVSYKYLSLDASGQVTAKTISMTAAEASTVNLTGAIHYPPYTVKRTDATSGGVQLNATTLCLETEARALAAELGVAASNVTEINEASPFPINYPADEPRRVWWIGEGADSECAGLLLAEKNAQGVGRPGHWVKNNTGLDDWTVDDIDTGEVGPVHPVIPMPQRDLLPNERAVVASDIGTAFSGVGFVIQRTDMASVNAPPAAAAGGSGFTGAQVSKLLSDVAHIRGQVDVIQIATVKE